MYFEQCGVDSFFCDDDKTENREISLKGRQYLTVFLCIDFYVGWMEALAICSSYYLWCYPSRTKASLGGLCGTYLGDDTLNVSI